MLDLREIETAEGVHPMSDKKIGGVRFAGTGRFVTIIPKKPMTAAGVSRVKDALTHASEKTGAFRTTGGTSSYGARKLPPK